MPALSFNEADTRAKLIDPALHRASWVEQVVDAERVPRTAKSGASKAPLALRSSTPSCKFPTAWPHLNNRYADWCKAEGSARAEPCAFKWTVASEGNRMIEDLSGISSSTSFAIRAAAVRRRPSNLRSPPRKKSTAS